MGDISKVFISYARKDGADIAKRLFDRLDSLTGFNPWLDTIDIRTGGWPKQIEEAIKATDVLCPVLTPGASESPVVQWEWAYAREYGKPIVPIYCETEQKPDFTKLPRWMSKMQAHEFEAKWQTIQIELERNAERERVHYSAPPRTIHFVERPVEFKNLRALLLKEDSREPVAITTALQGAGGFGKTTLAIELCNDVLVRLAYDDGIFWITLGEKLSDSDLLNRLNDIHELLDGKRPGYTAIRTSAGSLFDKLRGKDCLVVIDDVWQESHLRPFITDTRTCSYLITTRFTSIVSDFLSVKVDAMEQKQAVDLLSKNLNNTGDCRPELKALAHRLGNWPLLLESAGGTMRLLKKMGMPLPKAIAHVNAKLEAEGITALDRDDEKQRDRAVSVCIEASLGLFENNREQYVELAIFPENEPIPLAVIAELWNMIETSTRGLLSGFADAALLKLDLEFDTVKLHDVYREYIEFLCRDNLAAIHRKLLAAWPDIYKLPHAYA